MDLTALGHAGWLIEAEGLRLLCDPLVEVDHHGGVFEVMPRRRIRAQCLRPDFILISHRHTDHFDVRSLARLAALDHESVVITPDPLVAWAARQLGFLHVRQVAPGQRVELDGLQFVTTPSTAPDEWGVLLASAEGVIWNQVDTVFRSPSDVQRILGASLAGLGRSQIDLALVQWQPMLEIAAQLARGVEFPRAAYAELLAQLAAVDAHTIVPASAGTVHAAAYAWLNRIVCPVDEARFVRDAARVCPRATVLPHTLGACYRVRAGQVTVERSDDHPWIQRLDGGPTRDYLPHEVPAIRDVGQFLGPPAEISSMRDELAQWVDHTLAAALVAHATEFVGADPLRLAVDLVFADGSRLARTLVVTASACDVHPGIASDWDGYNACAGSMLWEVLQGRRNWGDVLLSGSLRGSRRAYTVTPAGLRACNLAPIFLYYALPYDTAMVRSIEWEVATAKG